LLSTVIPFSADSKRILQYAVEEADWLQHHDIATAHLLLGILRDEESVAASILRENGLSLPTAREGITDLLGGEVA
jgi:ATP-dependent Clp protease ATP-binding subunit ClpC